MIMLNSIDAQDKSERGEKAFNANGVAVLFEAISILLRTLYPVAPHVTHALWVELGFAAKIRRPHGCRMARGR